jgi:uncharacterized membrane protein (UPF0136 family)
METNISVLVNDLAFLLVVGNIIGSFFKSNAVSFISSFRVAGNEHLFPIHLRIMHQDYDEDISLYVYNLHE